jgi:hypothetical protein
MNIAETYVHDKIKKAGGLPQINETVKLILEHLNKTHLTGKGEPFTKKNYRLSLWQPTEEKLYNLVVSIFTTTLTSEYNTYQSVVGKHSDAIPMDKTIDRVQTMAEVIAMMCIADLINIRSTKGEQHIIDSCMNLKGIPETDKHGTVYHRPQPVESNHDPVQGNMILGSKLNYHENNICLDHINKINSIPLCLNKEFLLKYPEEPVKPFKNSPLTKEGKPGMTKEEKECQWGKWKSESMCKWAKALVKSDRLFVNHKPDSRGRDYVCGYYINYQGNSYKKVMVELANKEKLNNLIPYPKER